MGSLQNNAFLCFIECIWIVMKCKYRYKTCEFLLLYTFMILMNVTHEISLPRQRNNNLQALIL